MKRMEGWRCCQSMRVRRMVGGDVLGVAGWGCCCDGLASAAVDGGGVGMLRAGWHYGDEEEIVSLAAEDWEFERAGVASGGENSWRCEVGVERQWSLDQLRRLHFHPRHWSYTTALHSVLAKGDNIGYIEYINTFWLPTIPPIFQSARTRTNAHEPWAISMPSHFPSTTKSTCLTGCKSIAGKHILPSPLPKPSGLGSNSHSFPPTPSTFTPNHRFHNFSANRA